MMLVLGCNEPQVNLSVKCFRLWCYKSYYKLQWCSERKCCSTFKPLTLSFIILTTKTIKCDAQCEQKTLPYIMLWFEVNT